MRELSKTLKNYKGTYISRLAKYLDDHEDNTESLFLQKEFDASNEALETLNTYKTNSKPFEFKTLKDHFDISILENSGFDLDKVDNHIASINRILDFIKNKQEFMVSGEETTVNVESNSKPEKLVNPYPQVFSGPNAYQLFEKLHDTYKTTKTPLADYSFIYRKMYEEGYILESFRPQMFINWISKVPYERNDLDKIKTIGNCSTDGKIQTYNMIKKSL
jgi:hypothetical protein